MKNKVLRLAIVAVLVVAMVLSMAACNDPKPVVTETPTPVVTPTPTKTPDKTPDKTPTPTPVTPSAADDSALAKATYGIELKGNDFTYGVIVDADDATKKLSQVKVAFSKDLMENFKTFAADAIKWSVEYEGEGKLVKPNTNGTSVTGCSYTYTIDTKGVPTLTFTDKAPAGAYTVTATVKVEDNGFYFGRFGAIKAETVTYELTKIINVAKADLAVKAPNYVAPVKVLAEGVSEAPIAPVFVAVSDTLKASLESAYGDGYTYFLRAGSMVDPTKVGSYDITISAHKAKADLVAKEENIVPFAEIPAINHNVTFETGKQYFINGYDWLAVRDVATSILDINAVAGDEATKVKIARARYDALTDAQKAFFVTGEVVKDVTAATVATSYAAQNYVGKFFGTGSTPGTKIEIAVEFAGESKVLAGSAIYKVLTDLETTYKDSAVIEAWNKAVKDAKFLDYAKLAEGDAVAATKLVSFNIENATHVASYNAVKAYFDALSDADKVAVKATFTWTDVPQAPATEKDGVYQPTEVITSENGYTAFFLVSAKFGEKAVKEVKTLIAAAAAAYNRAVTNAGGKYIYTDTITSNENKYHGVQYYLNNAEVVAVTNQANTAFEKLSDAQKALLAELVENDADGTQVTANFDKAARNYDTLLGALVAMNKVVGYMEQVISHTNIEDLQHKADKTPAYANLNKIVYGTAGNYLTGADMNNTDAKQDRDTFNAVGDIIKAFATDKASLDAVVAEYKAMIDYVLAAEAYKAEQVAALNALIATEFVAENHTEGEIAVATASTNPVLAGIALAITNEKDPAISAKAGTTDYNAAKQLIVKTSVQNILSKKGLESYEDAKAAFEGLYNLDKAMTVFTKLYKNTAGTDAATGHVEGKFFFDFA